MGSYLGVLKVAAKRIGVSFPEYMTRLNRGEKWCCFGKHWENSDCFPPDNTRGSGRAQACKPCHLSLHRLRKRKQKNLNRDKVKGYAGRRVNRQIAKGLLPRAQALPCAHCGHSGNDRRHHYHHHKGYEEQHQLDVIALCAWCHVIEDRRLKGLETFVLEAQKLR